MGYVLYSISFFLLVLATVVYFFRQRIYQSLGPYISSLNLPSFTPRFLYTRLPTTFTDDMESGLSSSTFDLSNNVAEGDQRAGLDTKAKNAIKRIMETRNVAFDEARRVFMQMRFKQEGIGEDGRPKDPKFFSFS